MSPLAHKAKLGRRTAIARLLRKTINSPDVVDLSARRPTLELLVTPVFRSCRPKSAARIVA